MRENHLFLTLYLIKSQFAVSFLSTVGVVLELNAEAPLVKQLSQTWFHTAVTDNNYVTFYIEIHNYH